MKEKRFREIKEFLAYQRKEIKEIEIYSAASAISDKSIHVIQWQVCSLIGHWILIGTIPYDLKAWTFIAVEQEYLRAVVQLVEQKRNTII